MRMTLDVPRYLNQDFNDVLRITTDDDGMLNLLYCYDGDEGDPITLDMVQLPQIMAALDMIRQHTEREDLAR